MHFLNKAVIKTEEIDYSEMLLLDFCRLFPEVYGDFQQTMNVHLLKHLPHYVRLYGPLFTTSCFGFESMNNHLKSMVHGTCFVNSQVCLAVGLTKALPKLMKSFDKDLHDDLQYLLLRLSSKLLLREQTGQNSVKILGKMSTFQDNEELGNLISLFCEEHGFDKGMVRKFLRLRQNSNIFYSKEYKQAKTRNSYTVLLNNKDTVIVLYYLAIGNKLFAVTQILEEIADAEFRKVGHEAAKNVILRKYQGMRLCHYVREVKILQEYRIIDVSNIISNIIQKRIYMKLNKNKLFVSIPPNLLEHS